MRAWILSLTWRTSPQSPLALLHTLGHTVGGIIRLAALPAARGRNFYVTKHSDPGNIDLLWPKRRWHVCFSTLPKSGPCSWSWWCGCATCVLRLLYPVIYSHRIVKSCLDKVYLFSNKGKKTASALSEFYTGR